MKYFIILLGLIVVNLSFAAEYDYDFKDSTNAEGIYDSEGDFDGYNVKIRKITVDKDVKHLLITNGKGVKFFDSEVKAGVTKTTINTNTKTKYMTFRLQGENNMAFNCKIVVEWKWGWIQKPITMSLKVNTSGSKNKKTAKTLRPVAKSLNPLAEAFVGNDGNTHIVNFECDTDKDGCVSAKAQNISLKGTHSQIALLLADREFRNVTLSINNQVFRPELSVAFNGYYVYKINLPVRNKDVKLSITAIGGKSNCDASFVLLYKDVN
ncbi:hypothetical protein [Candidatus Uabimicrobium amorphum]|uniref:Uncharacterized protein n=1 Tax=Uabimicrobium amorphum TaxID=2596890 RepID=A0A5S9IS04_UABAM|nr:hypothetical protein [Candidatus Uabimicrobium amorphum]BBM86536.1 hypothetical protein UABAM_04922 [Candidatus Uabimicrobium amorphum]